MAPHGSYTTFLASINVAQWRSAPPSGNSAGTRWKEEGDFNGRFSRFIAIGRLNWEKAIGNFSAFQQLPRARFLITCRILIRTPPGKIFSFLIGKVRCCSYVPGSS